MYLFQSVSEWEVTGRWSCGCACGQTTPLAVWGKSGAGGMFVWDLRGSGATGPTLNIPCTEHTHTHDNLFLPTIPTLVLF